ncbi:MFS transporter [Acetobacter sp.]|jgi:MFS family permease|uniref:MFS transporter n=1 Tax=Acetobacter sp. TaxID=440 RepID=UPI0025C4ACC6|nr:MFS transporter [Acetobacter sp.]MCH4091521.1 MFS transporter [Acetobacter sp.]MCI1299499.1 MFS transporter [Acetobacter sp.]MCI1316911.1 MFS transporter [Acetobacter sp.]
MTSSPPHTSSVIVRIYPVLLFTLACYTVIGLQMAVVPLFVHLTLGYSAALAGFAVSAQYLATLATRTCAGKRLDTSGARPVVLTGLIVGALSGLLLAAATFCTAIPSLSLGLLLIGRALLGFSESWVAVGVIIWNMHRAGAAHSATVISWNGVCSYGGIALGAPIAAMIFSSHASFGGLVGVGLLSTLLFVACIPNALRQETTRPAPQTGPKPGFTAIFRAIMPYGCALGAGSVGFGAIVSCLTLYFNDRNWSGAAIALAVFGGFFVLTRFIFSNMIRKIGGERVTLISMGVETLGLLVIAGGSSPILANIGAALTGVGFSLVFPALGVMAIERLGAENRGVALGGFSVFLDLAIGASGPGLGMIIPVWGFPTLFVVAAAFCALGFFLTLTLRKNTHAVPAS